MLHSITTLCPLYLSSLPRLAASVKRGEAMLSIATTERGHADSLRRKCCVLSVGQSYSFVSRGIVHCFCINWM